MAARRNFSYSSHYFAFIRVQLTCLCAKAWGMNPGSWSHGHTCRAGSSLASWKCAGVASETAVVEWKDTESLARASGGDEERSRSMPVTSWSEWSSAQGWIRSCPTDDESGLREDRDRWLYCGGLLEATTSGWPSGWVPLQTDRLLWSEALVLLGHLKALSHLPKSHTALQSHWLKSLCLAITWQTSSQAALHCPFHLIWLLGSSRGSTAFPWDCPAGRQPGEMGSVHVYVTQENQYTWETRQKLGKYL